MDEVRRNTMVGAFMVLGLLAMGWLMTSFGELPSFLETGENDLVINVMDPRGIGEGTPIFLSGVQVGRVRQLRFKDLAHLDSGVEIVAAIKKQFVIPMTATAIVQPAGIGLGRGRIDLTVRPGQAPPLPAGEGIQGEMGSPWGDLIPDTLLASVDQTFQQFGFFLEELTPVAADLHDLLEIHTVEDVDAPHDPAQRLTANLSTVIERFDVTLRTFNDTFGDPEVKEGWRQLFANIRKMGEDASTALETIKLTSAELRRNLQAISTKLEKGIDDAHMNINDIAVLMRPILDNSARLTASLVVILNRIEEGRGTAGLFVNDARLYESLLMSSQRLTDLIDTIQRIFRKFELDGAIKVDVPTSLGTFRKSVDVPDRSQ